MRGARPSSRDQVVQPTTTHANLIALIAVAALAACGDNTLPDPMPDAAPIPVPEPQCCRHLPDEDAVRQCLLPMTTPNTCGVLVCHDPDGEIHRINFCGPMD